jgi:hypothetical protein
MVRSQIDVLRTCRELQYPSHYSFLSWLSFPSVEECMQAMSCLRLDVDSAVASPYYLRSHNFFWWVYWCHYVKGYGEYRATGRVDTQNTYYQHLVKYFLPLNQDPQLSAPSHEDVVTIIMRRFVDFDKLREHQTDEVIETIPPLNLFAAHPSVKKGPRLQLRDAKESLVVRYFDGHHRLLMAALCGIPYLPCMLEYEADGSEPLLGKIEEFRFDGKRLLLSGWILSAKSKIQVVDIRVDGETTAKGPIRERPDVAAAHPKIPHALYSGFKIDVIFEYLSPDEVIDFQIVGLNDWSPVGCLYARHVPSTLAAQLE